MAANRGTEDRVRTFGRLILLAVAALAAAPAFAADLPTRKEALAPVVTPALPSTWHIEVTGYAWGTSIAGSSGFGTLATVPFYASFGKILEHFQGALMGSIVARNDMFIGGLDLMWSRIGGGGVIKDAINADLTLTSGIATAFGGVRAPLGIPNLELYGTLGARYIYSGNKLTLTTPVFGFGATQTVNKGWVDPVAGFAAHYTFNDRWYMNVLGDIGGWSSSATGQALATIGYNWTPQISTTLGYRVLYIYEKQDTGYNYAIMEPRAFRLQQWMYGPLAGFKYGF
jgi:hypothetical protein